MDVEQEIKSIRERNAKVALDKAWETSWTRKLVIILITYLCAVVLLTAIHASNPLLGALVPCVGYVLSTLSLSFVRAYWEHKK